VFFAACSFLVSSIKSQHLSLSLGAAFLPGHPVYGTDSSDDYTRFCPRRPGLSATASFMVKEELVAVQLQRQSAAKQYGIPEMDGHRFAVRKQIIES
jgi:hypothetical protein